MLKHPAFKRTGVVTMIVARDASNAALDQGSQFTGAVFTSVLAKNGIAISMDEKGAWRDNVFAERPWRSIKYEEVYLRAYDSVGEARGSIGRSIDFYSRRRPHSSLDDMTA